MMNTDQELEQTVQRVRFSTTPKQDARILEEAFSIVSDHRNVCDTRTGVNLQTADDGVVSMSQKSRSSLLFRPLAGLCTAALLIVAGILWYSQPTMTWAQVVETVRAKPWIKISIKAQGKADEESAEMWLSFEKKILAERRATSVVFKDYRTEIRHRYDVKEKSLYRSADYSGEPDHQFHSTSAFVQGLFQIPEAKGKKTIVPGVDFVVKNVRTIEEAGKKWIEYEFAFEGSLVGDQDDQTKPVLRVDPETKLPVRMTVTDPNMKPKSALYLFEYPPEGPSDIYALSVPRAAKLVDLVPKENLKRIIDAVKDVHDNFDDYKVLYVSHDVNTPWYRGSLLLAWSKGYHNRFEMGVKYPGTKPTEEPPPQTDKQAWWKSRAKQFWFAPYQIDDGQLVFGNAGFPKDYNLNRQRPRDPAKWPKPKWEQTGTTRNSRIVPLHIAYPRSLLINRGSMNFSLVEKPTEGPPGTVLIKFGDNSKSWLDPNRGYLTVRTVSEGEYAVDGKPAGTSRTVETVKEAAQSPKGYWYPTLLRTLHVTEQDGKTKRMELIRHFYLNFEVDVPTSTFEPPKNIVTDHKGLD